MPLSALRAVAGQRRSDLTECLPLTDCADTTVCRYQHCVLFLVAGQRRSDLAECRPLTDCSGTTECRYQNPYSIAERAPSAQEHCSQDFLLAQHRPNGVKAEQTDLSTSRIRRSDVSQSHHQDHETASRSNLYSLNNFRSTSAEEQCSSD